MSAESVSVGEEGEGHIPRRGTENRKGAETSSGESVRAIWRLSVSAGVREGQSQR